MTICNLCDVQVMVMVTQAMLGHVWAILCIDYYDFTQHWSVFSSATSLDDI